MDDKSPAIFGRETFATVESKTDINVAKVSTKIAIYGESVFDVAVSELEEFGFIENG